MNGEMFVKLVIEMRRAQRDFFEKKSYALLAKAKKLERQVDEMISIYQHELHKLTPTQLELDFD